MFLNRSTYWALKALIYLASQPPSAAPHLSADVAAAIGAPGPATAKVLRRLALAGILVSLRGAGGGFLLARSPEELTVYDVYLATNGKVPNMPEPAEAASPSLAAGLEAFISATQAEVITAMRSTTIAGLLEGGDPTRAGSR